MKKSNNTLPIRTGVSQPSQAISGLVFNIVHGSFVDGPGVRTTVFLKGCPLRCLWCCNPEAQSSENEFKITPEKCDLCGNCAAVCHASAISISTENKDKNIIIDRILCNGCGKCIDVCFTGAIEYFGRRMTVDEVFDVVKNDEQYYVASGGGVTIGGGEPTYQPDFTYTLLKKCRDNFIHVAIDTCGYTNSAKSLEILVEADLLLFDIKGLIEIEHNHNTGASNKIILQNLKKLASMNKPIIIRMPLVPDYNDSEQNIKGIAELLIGMSSVQRIDLLPYHRFGVIKYKQLERICPIDIEAPPANMQRI